MGATPNIGFAQREWQVSRKAALHAFADVWRELVGKCRKTGLGSTAAMLIAFPESGQVRCPPHFAIRERPESALRVRRTECGFCLTERAFPASIRLRQCEPETTPLLQFRAIIIASRYT